MQSLIKLLPSPNWIAVLGVLMVATLLDVLWVNPKQSELNGEYNQIFERYTHSQILCGQEENWTMRGKWLMQHAPMPGEADEMQSAVLNSVLQGARDNQLQILEQSSGDIEKGSGYLSVGVRLKVEGPMENLCRWISQLQTPESSYAVSGFSMHIGSDEHTVFVALTIKRYFQEGAK